MAIRVVCFIDGFNFYHAIASEPQWRQFKWLDLQKLCELFTSSKETIVRIYWFTAFYPADQEKRQRHELYLKVLRLIGVIPVLTNSGEKRNIASFVAELPSVTKRNRPM